jgi:flagellar hook-associated protein 2
VVLGAEQMSAINFSGLGSGLDTKSIVSALVNVSRGPINQLNKQKGNYQVHKSSFEQIKSMMESLKTAAEDFDSIKEIQSFKTSSSDEKVATITAEGNALQGNFAMEVTQLATNERRYSNGVASNTTTGLLGTGSITLQQGSDTAFTVNVDANTTLTTLVNDINQANKGVRAGILYDGSQYRLQLTGEKTGAANALTVTQTGLDIGLADAGNLKQSAADAAFTLDGFAMTSASNTVTETLDGVTFELLQTGTTTVDISPDVDGVKEKLQKFVDAYNMVAKRVKDELAYGGSRNDRKLTGDSTLRTLQADLSSLVSSTVSGLTGDNALPSFGIKTGASGLLEIDSEDFEAAMNADFGALKTLFVSDNDNSITGKAEETTNLVKKYTDFVDGLLTTRVKGLDSRIGQADEQIARLEERLVNYEKLLNKQFMAMEKTVAAVNAQSGYLQSLAMMPTMGSQQG